MDKDDLVTLEGFIDRYGLGEVLSSLGYICSEKAEHVATNWQDVPLGKRWMKLATVLDFTVAKVEAAGDPSAR